MSLNRPAGCLALLAMFAWGCRGDPARSAGPILASGSGGGCTATGEQDELIGDLLYSDPSIQAGEYVVSIDGSGGGGSMYYLPGLQGKSRWGALTSQNSNSSGQVEHHDTNGDGVADGGCEEHILPNGVYDINFHRVAGGAPTFYRTIAMLGQYGVIENESGVYQDVVIPFDLSPVTVSNSGWFGAATQYTGIGADGSELSQFSTSGPTVSSGSTVWFASTYVATGSGGRGWFNRANQVLNSFNFDYGRDTSKFGPATNSFPTTNNSIPMAHVFAAPGAQTTFQVRLRAILPFHLGTSADPGTTVSQSMTVTVTGSNVDFSNSANPTAGQPVAFTAVSMLGDPYFEYYWDFGDGANSGWSASKQVQHTYASGGQKTVKLIVRNASLEGPTDTLPKSVTVAEPLTVNLTGPDSIEVSGTYTWRAYASGGTGSYTYQWYYRPPSGSEQAVGTNSFRYARSVTYGSPGYFRIRVLVTSGTASVSRFVWVSNGQPAP